MIKTRHGLNVAPTNVAYEERLCYLTSHFNAISNPVFVDPISGNITLSYIFVVKLLDYLTYENSDFLSTDEIQKIVDLIAYESDTAGITPSDVVKTIDTVLLLLAEGQDISKYLHDVPSDTPASRTECVPSIPPSQSKYGEGFKSNYCGEQNA